MPKPVVVTVMVALMLCPFESENATLHVPAATPVAVKVAEGPFALVGAIVAICPELGLHVLVWLSAPV